MRSLRFLLAGALLASLAAASAGCKREAVAVSGVYDGTEVEKPPYITWEGKPTVVLIPGTRVSYIQELEKEERYLVGRKWYCFYEGHWFVGDDWQGPWLATSDLPHDFLDIPKGHPRYRIVKHHPDYKGR